MSPVRKNIIANMLGSGWVAALSLAFVPLYIHFMGIEAYGLVGFYVTLQVLFSVLDMGLTATISRELARLSAQGGGAAIEMRNVVRTLETIYWALAVFIILTVGFSAHWIATVWLNTNQLSSDDIQMSVMLMGVVIAFRMPYGFYSGGLIGMQRQVLLNVIKICVETFRNGGGVLVLWLFSPTITAFFLWHAAAGIVGVCVLGVVLWRCLPKAIEKARFTPSLFRRLWRFGAGMLAIALLSLLLVEMDKLVLSKMLSLAEFGHYVLASTLAMGLNLIIVPIFSAIHPRLTQLVASHDELGLSQLYHKGCQLMTVLVMPVAFVLCFFAEEVLLAWTQEASIAQYSAPLLSLLVIGTAFNAMMNIPYALQLAHGWIKLSILSNIIAVIILVPALFWMISRYGVIGAASIWTALNIGYVLFNSPIIHAKLLKGEFKHWLVSDFGIPTLVALIIVVLFWMVMPSELSLFGHLAWIVFTLIMTLSLCALAAPMVRKMLWEIVLGYRSSRLYGAERL